MQTRHRDQSADATRMGSRCKVGAKSLLLTLLGVDAVGAGAALGWSPSPGRDLIIRVIILILHLLETRMGNKK